MQRPQLEFNDWMLAAACRGRTDLFFAPDDSETRAERRQREVLAKEVCGICEVRMQCLNEALYSDESFGIWGGLNERERRALHKSSAAGQAAASRGSAGQAAASRGSAGQAAASNGSSSPQDIAGPGRLARLPAVVVQGRTMSSSPD